MKPKLLFVLGLLFTLPCFSQVWDWTKPEPNGIIHSNSSSLFSREHDAAHEIATDAQGYIYVLGDYEDSLYLNNNFIVKGRGSYICKI
jgi:hypothetical protein